MVRINVETSGPAVHEPTEPLTPDLADKWLRVQEIIHRKQGFATERVRSQLYAENKEKNIWVRFTVTIVPDVPDSEAS